MKKIFAILLASALVLPCILLSSCGKANDSEVPEEMKKASADTAQYVLYVPETWKCDVASGATSAYYSDSDRSSVNVMIFSLGNSDPDISDWWDDFEEDYKSVYKDFEIISREAVKLDGSDGEKIVFTGSLTHKDQTVNYKFMQVAAIGKKFLSAPQVYVFTYTSSPEVYDSHLSDVQKMLDNFKFN